MILLVEHGEHGSSTAAPIASKIIQTYLGVDEDTAEPEGSQGQAAGPAGGHSADKDTTDTLEGD